MQTLDDIPYNVRLEHAIDFFRDSLLDTDHDIDDIVEYLSMQYKVDKSDLLEWYEKNFE
jgi:hypothetical protein